MKKITLAFIVLLVAVFTFSFKSNRHPDVFICNYTGHSHAVSNRLSLQKPAPIAVERVNKIMNTIGLRQNFSIHSANVDNASAIVNGSSRYILYNPQFMQSVRNTAGVDWTSYTILAHQVGHHLNGHTIQRGGSHPAYELEAGEFSGFVLGKMGANLTKPSRQL